MSYKHCCNQKPYFFPCIIKSFANTDKFLCAQIIFVCPRIFTMKSAQGEVDELNTCSAFKELPVLIIQTLSLHMLS